MDAHGLVEALQDLITEALEYDRESVGYGLDHGRGNANPPTTSQLLDSLRKHYPGSSDGTVRDDYLAEGDADSDSRRDAVRDLVVLLSVVGLKSKGRADCVGCARELSEQGIATQLEHCAPVARHRLRESTEGALYAFVGDSLVDLHQRRRPDYVGVQDYG